MTELTEERLIEMISPQTIEDRVHEWRSMTRRLSDNNALRQSVCVIRSLQQQVNRLQSEVERKTERNQELYQDGLDKWQREQAEIYQRDTRITELQQQVNTLTEAFGSSVVYSAIRYYYKQGLFEPNEYFDLDTAMGKAADLRSIKGERT